MGKKKKEKKEGNRAPPFTPQSNHNCIEMYLEQKTLKLDSGERIIILAVVRTLIPSRIIEQYTSFFREQHFEPASTRSLFRMLDVCSASMQKSLHGLDSITAERTEAFDNLREIVDTLVENGAKEHWAEIMRRDLKEAKRYLKTDYKTHVGRNETTATIVPYMP